MDWDGDENGVNVRALCGTKHMCDVYGMQTASNLIKHFANLLTFTTGIV